MGVLEKLIPKKRPPTDQPRRDDPQARPPTNAESDTPTSYVCRKETTSRVWVGQFQSRDSVVARPTKTTAVRLGQAKFERLDQRHNVVDVVCSCRSGMVNAKRVTAKGVLASKAK